MFLADSEIKRLGASALAPFDPDALGPCSYDLHAKAFCRVTDDAPETVEHVTLKPLESIFVSCREVLTVPVDAACMVNIRNSKLRQGFSAESPVYYPGHKTRVFFRLTNLSNEEIELHAGESYAALFFTKLEGAVEVPYRGTFSDEFDFRGMAGYTDQYRKAMHAVEEKTRDLKSLERGIYANVIVFMTIFVALFTIINII